MITVDQVQQKILASTNRLINSPLWRFMDSDQQKLTLAGRDLTQEYGPVAKSWFQALADRLNSGVHATPTTAGYWWELWGLDQGETGDVQLLAAFPEECCDANEARELLGLWTKCGFHSLELRHVMRVG